MLSTELTVSRMMSLMYSQCLQIALLSHEMLWLAQLAVAKTKMLMLSMLRLEEISNSMIISLRLLMEARVLETH